MLSIDATHPTDPALRLVNRVDVLEAPDLVHRVRGLQFFKRHIAQGIVSIGRREALPARIDDVATTGVFLTWIDRLMEQKSYSDYDRRDYITFGAGMLLKTLLERRSIKLLAAPPKDALATSANPIIACWPEGYLATAYCLSVLDAVFEQEGVETFTLTPAAADIGVWQSFRENTSADPQLAIPYLDLFVGNEPNWSEPTWARNRPKQRRGRGQRHLS